MKTDRKTRDNRAATKPRRSTKAKSAAKKPTGDKSASRQKAGIVAVIATAGKTSKKTTPASKPAKKAAKKKPVRDDFKMPAGDYALIEALKQRALEFNRPTKKNELLRAGLQALGALDNSQLQQRLLALEPAKQKAASATPAKPKA